MSIKVMKQALDALNSCDCDDRDKGDGQYFDQVKVNNAITALRDAIQDAESYAAAYPDNLVKRASEAFEAALERDWSKLADEGSQVAKVWWDGYKLIMQPVSVDDMYEVAQDGHNFYHVAANKVLELKEKT